MKPYSLFLLLVLVGCKHEKRPYMLPDAPGRELAQFAGAEFGCPEGHWCTDDIGVDGKREVWIRCDAGLEVTDLKECPEYRDAQWGAPDLNGVRHSLDGHYQCIVGKDCPESDLGTGSNTIGPWICRKCSKLDWPERKPVLHRRKHRTKCPAVMLDKKETKGK